MLIYTLRRLAFLVPTLIGITIVTFVIISLAPGNPADVMQGETGARISPEQYQAMQQLYGLDKPLPVRYAIWLRRLLSFDFGNSFVDHRPVSTKIK